MHEDRLLVAGGYVLRTSRTDWSVQEVARTYGRLTEIENTFRVMKSDLGLRPVYHSNDDRIVGHLFITVLAYHVAHLVRTKLKKAGIHNSWDTIRNELNEIKRVTTKLPMSQTRALTLNVDQNLTPMLERVFEILGFSYDPDATRTKQILPLGTENSPKAARLMSGMKSLSTGTRMNSRWRCDPCIRWGELGTNTAFYQQKKQAMKPL